MPLSLFLPGYSLDSKLESGDATIIIGWYTLIIHFLMTFFFLDVYRGNESDWVLAPTFEYTNETMYLIALTLAIYSATYIVIASLGLIRGVKTVSFEFLRKDSSLFYRLLLIPQCRSQRLQETRIYYFPWLILTAIEIAALLYQVVLLWWRYSYDVGISMIIGSWRGSNLDTNY